MRRYFFCSTVTVPNYHLTKITLSNCCCVTRPPQSFHFKRTQLGIAHVHYSWLYHSRYSWRSRVRMSTQRFVTDPTKRHLPRRPRRRSRAVYSDDKGACKDYYTWITVQTDAPIINSRNHFCCSQESQSISRTRRYFTSP